VKKKIKELLKMVLSDIAEIKTDFPDADFWLIRVHDENTVGKPVKEFKPNRIGIKVTATDVVDAKYLYYVFQHLWSKGVFKQISSGTLNKVNIKTSDIRNIPVG
jgi:hypothetical protein